MSKTGREVSEIRDSIRRWFDTGLRAVDPYWATRTAIEWDGKTLLVQGNEIPVTAGARIVGIAVGKAAADMARGLEDVFQERLSGGMLLTKDGHARSAPPSWTVFEASHPVPDQRGVQATRSILTSVSSLGADDVVIALISGGGSALLESPTAPLSLAEIQLVTSLLLRAGAPIQDLNAVRSELSDVKGGGLRRSMGSARCVSLILSDVLGNDPSVIASGPTSRRDSNPLLAREILERYGILDQVPSAMLEMLDQPSELDQGDLTAADDLYAIVGDNALFLDAISHAAQADGLVVSLAMALAEGEARDLADRFLELAAHQPANVDVVLGGGEATVTVRGNGTGGRNTEFALEAALRLQADGAHWVIASLASDGQDGSVDAAGAIVDAGTVARGERIGLSAEASLGDNDSGGYFAALNELFETGPTGTNVNDVYLAVRVKPLDASA